MQSKRRHKRSNAFKGERTKELFYTVDLSIINIYDKLKINHFIISIPMFGCSIEQQFLRLFRRRKNICVNSPIFDYYIFNNRAAMNNFTILELFYRLVFVHSPIICCAKFQAYLNSYLLLSYLWVTAI